MLEKFHVPKDLEIRVRVQDVRWTTEELFKASGMPDADAKQAADVLMYADVRVSIHMGSAMCFATTLIV